MSTLDKQPAIVMRSGRRRRLTTVELSVLVHVKDNPNIYALEIERSLSSGGLASDVRRACLRLRRMGLLRALPGWSTGPMQPNGEPCRVGITKPLELTDAGWEALNGTLDATAGVRFDG